MLVEATPANVRAVQPAGLATYTAGEHFHAVVAGQTLSFDVGHTVLLAPSLAATLIGMGAPDGGPMTAQTSKHGRG